MTQQQLISWSLAPLAEALDRQPLTARADAMVTQVLEQLDSTDATAALVLEHERPAGIFTLRDAVRVAMAAPDLRGRPIAEVMTRPLVTLAHTHPAGLLAALDLFRRHRIRHLPVLDDEGALVGLLTLESVYRTASIPRRIIADLVETNRALQRVLDERPRAHTPAALYERERPGRDPRDSHAQLLHVVHSQAQAAQDMLAAGRLAVASTCLSSLIAVIQEAQGEARQGAANAEASHTSMARPPAICPQGESLRLLLVDDNERFRHSLGQLLQLRGFVIAGEAADGYAAIAQARALQPDLVLMDISMPQMNGLEATSAILAEVPATQVVVLTVADDDATLFEAIRRGAAGYLLKSMNIDDLCDRLLGLTRGEAVLSPGLAHRLLSALPTLAPAAAEDAPTAAAVALTAQQIKVLTLLAQGNTYKEIGRQLGYSERAIRYQLSHAIKQLQVTDRASLIAFTRRQMQRGAWPPRPLEE